MGIGTSLGAFYDDEHHYAAAQWDDKYDDNVITPNQMQQNKQLDQVEQTELGGTEIANKLPVMPFPDNRNPDSDFSSRFGSLPPSGILNDLKKPSDISPPLARKINFLNSPDEIMQGVEGVHSLPGGNASAGPGRAETVDKAALQYKGETYEGQNHGFALGDIMDKYGSDISMSDIKDGFTTSKGRFVSREEAFDIAKDQKQIRPEVLPALTADSNMLLSEDLSH